MRRAATSTGDKKRERALLLGSRRVHVNSRAGDLLFQPRRCVRRASVVPGRDQPAAAGRGYAAGYVTPGACDFRRGRQQRGRRLRRKRRPLRRPLGTPLQDTCRVAKPAAITVTNISSACKRVSGPMSVVAALALLRRGDAAACPPLRGKTCWTPRPCFTWCTAVHEEGSACAACPTLQGVVHLPRMSFFAPSGR